ncbi:hypothetical protein CPT_Saba_056 [Proteus phage Saba]|uniref:Big-1 domain-containing protein n=1 Tax=Proteus phage Saba TaxID=2596672 RepID=A0A5B9N759_9CAUD|nr:hypothetical protein JT320_gp56 [Proteus phage Saba]QEG09429.1 hypothetical protein CPT_Saba_056 [Proteus phage Saba]
MTAKVTKDGKPAVGETVKFTASSLNNVGPLSGLESETSNESGVVTKTLSPTLTDKYVKGTFVIQATTQGKTATTTAEITPDNPVDNVPAGDTVPKEISLKPKGS